MTARRWYLAAGCHVHQLQPVRRRERFARGIDHPLGEPVSSLSAIAPISRHVQATCISFVVDCDRLASLGDRFW